MIKKHKNKFLISGGVVLVIGLSLILAYGLNLKDPVSQLAKKIYPAAIIGGNPVSLSDWENYLEIAHKTDPTGKLAVAESNFIANKQKQALVSKLGIKVNSANVAAEYQFDKSEFKDQYETFLDEYFSGQDKLFVKFVAFPQYFDSLLRIKYNSDTNTNSKAYAKAQGLLTRIKNGEKFDDVAKDSEDQVTSTIGGDLGVVEETQVLPEIITAVKKETLGEVNKDIVISRYGYHILYPVESAQESGQKVWHIKHIYVATTGYENWVSSQLSSISVWQIK